MELLCGNLFLFIIFFIVVFYARDCSCIIIGHCWYIQWICGIGYIYMYIGANFSFPTPCPKHIHTTPTVNWTVNYNYHYNFKSKKYFFVACNLCSYRVHAQAWMASSNLTHNMPYSEFSSCTSQLHCQQTIAMFLYTFLVCTIHQV